MTERRSQTDPEPATYTVQPHDSLPSIAERLGHPGEWQALRDANADAILDYNVLLIGMVLTLPEGWGG